MGRIILSKLCYLISRCFDGVGMGAFNISGHFDNWSNDLVGKPRFNFPEIIKKLHDE